MKPTAADVIKKFALQPHPEGGFYRETYRAAAAAGERGACTHIYYLLAQGERSHWHRVDASESWHWYAGDALLLHAYRPEVGLRHQRLGNRLLEDEVPHALILPGEWQSAESEGEWTLVGCTVAPAFEFAGFELAPPGWSPPQGTSST